MRALTSLAAAAAASAALVSAASSAAASGTLLWTDHVDVAVYTGAALSRVKGSHPTFAASTWLNPPVEIEVATTGTANDTSAWAYTTSIKSAALQVDQARHAAGYFPSGTAYVDTVGVESVFGGYSTCTVLGFASTGPKAGPTPVWTATIPSPCNADVTIGQMYQQVAVSDDGSVAAVVFGINETAAGVAAFDAQTGKPLFAPVAAAIEKGGAQRVAVSSNGKTIAFAAMPNLLILSSKDGSLKGNITIPFILASAVSDDGSIVAVGAPEQAQVFAFSADIGAYTPLFNLDPSDSTQPWWVTDISISTDDAGLPLAAVGWEDGNVSTVRVTAHNLTDGSFMSGWTSQRNLKCQNQASVKTDGPYIGVGLWGGDAPGDAPTAVLLKAGVEAPLFTFSTPGSMFGVDVVVDDPAAAAAAAAGGEGAGAAADIVYLAVAGKDVPANDFGNGGDAFVFKVVVTA